MEVEWSLGWELFRFDPALVFSLGVYFYGCFSLGEVVTISGFGYRFSQWSLPWRGLFYVVTCILVDVVTRGVFRCLFSDVPHIYDAFCLYSQFYRSFVRLEHITIDFFRNTFINLGCLRANYRCLATGQFSRNFNP